MKPTVTVLCRAVRYYVRLAPEALEDAVTHGLDEQLGT